MESQITKPCTKCGKEKLLSAFNKDRGGVLGHGSQCKSCRWQYRASVYAARREATPDGTKKKCTQCGENKDVVLFQNGGDQFGRRNTCLTCDAVRERNRKSKLSPEQKAKNAAYISAWHKGNRGEVLADRRLKSTGFSHRDFIKAKEAQGNCCAICHTGFTEITTKDTHADHDHLTGERRGVLCAKCNRLLGFANDSAVLLRAAAEYLENPPLRGVL